MHVASHVLKQHSSVRWAASHSFAAGIMASGMHSATAFSRAEGAARCSGHALRSLLPRSPSVLPSLAAALQMLGWGPDGQRQASRVCTCGIFSQGLVAQALADAKEAAREAGAKKAREAAARKAEEEAKRAREVQARAEAKAAAREAGAQKAREAAAKKAEEEAGRARAEQARRAQIEATRAAEEKVLLVHAQPCACVIQTHIAFVDSPRAAKRN